MLSDTGLGKEMHSVISQGRVESIVTSKPRDRRLLIEEAAGLGKHRKRRRRAQLKLERTQDNLDRALDVEREARSRLRPLKRQAEAAELHARLERQMLEARWELARDRAAGPAARGAERRSAASQQAREQREAVERELGDGRRPPRGGRAGARSAQRAARGAVASLLRRAVGGRPRVLPGRGGPLGRRRGRRATGAQPRSARVAARCRTRPTARSGRRVADRSARGLARGAGARRRGRARPAAVRAREAAAGADADDRGASRGRQACGGRARRRPMTASSRPASRSKAAERAVEAARRESARVGGELAAVNQFLRSHATASHGATALADELEVDPGYELALAAALDGRLRAGLVDDRVAAAALLERTGAEGGRALIAGPGPGPTPEGGALPRPPATAPRVMACRWALARRSRALSGSPITSAARRGRWRWRGCCWPTRGYSTAGSSFPTRLPGSAVTRERARLVGRWPRAASGAGARGGARAGGAQPSRAARPRQRGGGRRRARGARRRRARWCELRDRRASEIRRADAHRAAVRGRDEAAEERAADPAQIDRRRSAPDEGPHAGRKAQLTAELRPSAGRATARSSERAERAARIGRLEGAIASDTALAPAIAGVVESLQQAAERDRRAARPRSRRRCRPTARRASRSPRELRSCAQEEAGLHAQLHAESEALTESEVAPATRARPGGRGRAGAARARRAPRARGRRRPTSRSPRSSATACGPGSSALARRREQLGPVNPLAQQEYAEALEHVEELEHQRADLETALRELREADRRHRPPDPRDVRADVRGRGAQLRGRRRPAVSRRQGPAAAGDRARRAGAGARRARGCGVARTRRRRRRELGRGRGADGPTPRRGAARLPEEELGVEIEITPAGKAMKRLSLLSGGEKSMTALAFLFAVFLARPCPFYILDEVEAALDDLNIDRFLAAAAPVLHAAPSSSSSPTRSARWRPPTCCTACRWAATACRRSISRRLPAVQDAA